MKSQPPKQEVYALASWHAFLHSLLHGAGSFALNPATQQPIPIWVADYVLGSYGSGAIMAVPAHDTRDHAFAQAYSLPIVQVVEGSEELPFAGAETLIGTCLHHMLYAGCHICLYDLM